MQISSVSQAGLSALQSGDDKFNIKSDRLSSTSDTRSTAAAIVTLGGEQEEWLAESGWKDDQQFQDVASKLDAKQLAQLVDTLKALEGERIPGTLHPASGGGTAQKLLMTLVPLGAGKDLADGAERILEKAAELASAVQTGGGSDLYKRNGAVSEVSLKAVERLSNFVKSVSSPGAGSELMDRVESFGEEHQDTLYNLVANDRESALSLMENLSERSDETRDTVLGLFAEQLSSVEPIIPGDGSKELVVEKDAWTGATLDHDDTNLHVVQGMIEDTIQLMEDYAFNDEQLTHLTGQLSTLDSTDQRAALAITGMGMDLLVGGAGKGQQLDLEGHEKALEVINGLRSDGRVLEVVAKSRMGEMRTDEGKPFYALKKAGDSERDQQAMVELLVTDAWVNSQTSEQSDVEMQSLRLANQLLEMDATDRDGMAASLNELDVENVKPLTELSVEELDEAYGGLQARTSSMALSDELPSLLEAEAQLEPAQREAFWQAAELAGDQVDGFARTLMAQSEPVQQKLIEVMAGEQQRLSSGEQDADYVATRLAATREMLSMEMSDSQKLAFLNRTF